MLTILERSQSIFFPALEQLQADLDASSSTLALTVSLFILGQGFFPQIWTAISEVSGRKPCYLSALGERASFVVQPKSSSSLSEYALAFTLCQ